ncbi:hypothetical protein BDIM_11510 [Brevundimonas diminuta ATCC 11568]|nr:hypothetical protein BDIM_11510 [Brevundimonas diminuta ATCC 11568]
MGLDQFRGNRASAGAVRRLHCKPTRISSTVISSIIAAQRRKAVAPFIWMST